MTDAKQVLDNWMARNQQDCSQDEQYHAQKAYTDALEETVEELKKVVWDSLMILENDQLGCCRYNAIQHLTSGLNEHGWPDHDGDEPGWRGE